MHLLGTNIRQEGKLIFLRVFEIVFYDMNIFCGFKLHPFYIGLWIASKRFQGFQHYLKIHNLKEMSPDDAYMIKYLIDITSKKFEI